ncbi:hypothetical protein BKA56DRAFT_606371 [Ilyonectria sp. MPI-CAGE-AT-0026]|nr:hypothetical protein BKA56DRAFT_606371 [Ilyonectria sp. MPI-CAGE-AT-0026]
MAMAALTNLADFLPFWIEQVKKAESEWHQAKLAAIAATHGKNLETKPLRNKDSTDSLATLVDIHGIIAPDDPSGKHQAELAAIAATHGKNLDTKPFHNKGSSESRRRMEGGHIVVALRPTLDEKIPHIALDAHHRTLQQCPSAGTQLQGAIEQERQQAGTRQRSPSMVVLAEGVPVTYRTRNWTWVYYCSIAQIFIHDLHQFVSSSGWLILKAKVSVKSDYCKRTAKADVSEEGKNGEECLEGSLSQQQMIPWISNLISSPRPNFGPDGAKGRPLGVYDVLGDGLQRVQGLCERGALRLLRDGECSAEIKEVLKLLLNLREMTSKEMERVKREESKPAKEAGELGKVRTTGRIGMPRDFGDRNGKPPKLEAAKYTIDPSAALEVACISDEDANVDSKMLELLYRRTPTMWNRKPPGL